MPAPGGKQESESSSVDLKGWLLKLKIKEGTTQSVWNKRWFVVQDEYMQYFKKDRMQKPVGWLPIPKMLSVRVFKDDAIIPGTTRRSTNTFEIKSETRTFLLRAKNSAEVERWVKGLYYARHGKYTPRSLPQDLTARDGLYTNRVMRGEDESTELKSSERTTSQHSLVTQESPMSTSDDVSTASTLTRQQSGGSQEQPAGEQQSMMADPAGSGDDPASNWEECWDEEYECYYYYNVREGTSLWVKPECLMTEEERATARADADANNAQHADAPTGNAGGAHDGPDSHHALSHSQHPSDHPQPTTHPHDPSAYADHSQQHNPNASQYLDGSASVYADHSTYYDPSASYADPAYHDPTHSHSHAHADPTHPHASYADRDSQQPYDHGGYDQQAGQAEGAWQEQGGDWEGEEEATAQPFSVSTLHHVEAAAHAWHEHAHEHAHPSGGDGAYHSSEGHSYQQQQQHHHPHVAEVATAVVEYEHSHHPQQQQPQHANPSYEAQHGSAEQAQQSVYYAESNADQYDQAVDEQQQHYADGSSQHYAEGNSQHYADGSGQHYADSGQHYTDGSSQHYADSGQHYTDGSSQHYAESGQHYTDGSSQQQHYGEAQQQYQEQQQYDQQQHYDESTQHQQYGDEGFSTAAGNGHHQYEEHSQQQRYDGSGGHHDASAGDYGYAADYSHALAPASHRDYHTTDQQQQHNHHYDSLSQTYSPGSATQLQPAPHHHPSAAQWATPSPNSPAAATAHAIADPLSQTYSPSRQHHHSTAATASPVNGRSGAASRQSKMRSSSYVAPQQQPATFVPSPAWGAAPSSPAAEAQPAWGDANLV